MYDFKKILTIAVVLSGFVSTFSEAEEPDYNEANVPQYKMIDPLVMTDGTRVTDKTLWRRRRAEIQRLFEQHVYGKTPATEPVRFELVEENSEALDGKAVRRQIRAHFTDEPGGPGMNILIYLPAKAKGPVPIFVGLNFYGNQTICDDPAVLITQSYVRNRKQYGITNNRATEESRGKASGRWPLDLILSRGYGLATMYCGEIEPDKKDGFNESIRALYPYSAEDSWAAVGAWAWGLSRALDYFELDRRIDEKHVVVIGHSRLGKAALWAGACDERFAMVVSNNSGCGGAALSKRVYGETVKRINRTFPHWFCGNFKQYNNNESALPLDQHMLLSMVAPRPLYVASAVEDRWADPRGEFLVAKAASRVYKFLGTEGLPASEMPFVNEPSHGRIGYHIRSGKHNITGYDWSQYLDFADKNVRNP
ncbi:MAG: acetylxylan esterase [Kiritimatiellia bacterium]